LAASHSRQVRVAGGRHDPVWEGAVEETTGNARGGNSGGGDVRL
jgi:hypothetical protein